MSYFIGFMVGAFTWELARPHLRRALCRHEWARNEHLPELARECGKCGTVDFDGGELR